MHKGTLFYFVSYGMYVIFLTVKQISCESAVVQVDTNDYPPAYARNGYFGFGTIFRKKLRWFLGGIRERIALQGNIFKLTISTYPNALFIYVLRKNLKSKT